MVTVAALPVQLPDEPLAFPVRFATTGLSRFRVTVPLVPPPLRFVPAVTPVMSPVVGAAHEGIPDARVRTSVSEPFASFANVVVVSA